MSCYRGSGYRTWIGIWTWDMPVENAELSGRDPSRDELRTYLHVSQWLIHTCLFWLMCPQSVVSVLLSALCQPSWLARSWMVLKPTGNRILLLWPSRHDASGICSQRVCVPLCKTTFTFSCVMSFKQHCVVLKDDSFSIIFLIHLKCSNGENGSGIKVTEEDGGGEKEKKSSWARD